METYSRDYLSRAKKKKKAINIKELIETNPKKKSQKPEAKTENPVQENIIHILGRRSRINYSINTGGDGDLSA